MASLAPPYRFRAFTAGSATLPVRPLVGGKLYTYAAGTTTPKATYTDADGLIENTNPVILDARGEADVRLGLGAYKFILTDSADAQQGAEVDNIESVEQAIAVFAELLASSAGAGMIGYDPDIDYPDDTLGHALAGTIKTVRQFGEIGVGNDAAVLQAALDSMTDGGDLYATDPVYSIGGTMLTASHAKTRLILNNAATINYTGNTALKMTAAGCEVVGGKSGGFVGPASWDGINTAPTYGVIWITAINCSVIGTRLYNVKKVGVWFKDVEDGTVQDCLIEGNYPSGSWTGVETGHWGVVFDPGVGASGGNFKLLDNTIKSCVQGCQPGNYGAGGVVRGFNAVGGIFEGCWNHGIYSNFTNGAVISGISFNRCQIPVVISGNYNTVTGNTIHTAQSVVGDERDITGISVRDGSFNVVSNNTIRGLLNPPSNGVVINIQDVSGASDLIGNVVSGNTIDMPAGLGVAIRVSASTKICSRNIIIGNTIRGSGPVAEGLIGVYGGTGKVGGNVLGVTKASPGVITLTAAHGLVVNDQVIVLDFQGMTQINGSYLVNSTPSASSLSLKTIAGTPVDTTGFGTWTSGGEVRRADMQNIGNKVIGNVVNAMAQTFGVYLISQRDATVENNTVEFGYNAGGAQSVSTVALFDSYRCSVTNNTSVVAPIYGANLSVLAYREFSGTVTQQVFGNTTSLNNDQVDTTRGAVFQAVESLSGSGLLADVVASSVPSLPCAPGSTWRNKAGGANSILYLKQSALDGTGWAPMGVGPIDATAADLANKATSINTAEKYSGKLVWDTTNTRMMRALGSTDVSGWRVIDGSATVTPV